jgi:two-component system, OmpR family, phosphate regulon sensor histidine kinase PhoR
VNADRSPRSVALFSASLITGLLALTYTLIVYFLEREFELLWVMLFVVTGFIISYYVIAYFIEKFLYRKVKIIYKTIHSFQSQSDRKPTIRMGEDVLGEVNKEVADWANEKIKEIKELTATDDFRREFIGNLAHELKTPIFNISGFIDTLLESDLDDPELSRKFLQKAMNNCDRMSDLVKDLDQITRYESGNMPLELTRFDVVELARKTIDSLDHLAREKNISLRIKNPNERSIFVEADKGRVSQVFTNLLVNSISYGKVNGETTIRFYDMSDNILIEVVDDGIGIAKTHLPRIFERFYRVDKSRSRNEGGSGLGLAICKHIIESHNQTISVRSTEEIGSTFAFTLKKSTKA